jgi:hypothetical protein
VLGGTDGTDRRKWLIIGLVAALALSFVLVIVLLDRDSGRDPGAQGPASEAPKETSSPSAAPTASATSQANPPAQSPSAGPGQPDNSALPDGWQLHTDRTGFKVPAPEGWRESRRTYPWGPQVYFNGPDNSRIKIDQTSTQVKSDALADLQEDEAAKRSDVQNYQRVGEIRRVDGYFVDAAEWDWLETIDGQRMHVRLRNFVTSPGKQAYAIEFRLPVTEWNRVGDAQFKTITRGFEPRK